MTSARSILPTAAARPPIPGHPYDVIIIGGGINGAAIARECALGGKRTLLLEQHDFGSGTSSRATRIIHGGLRYLEHGELALVRESLRERELLLRTKPNLVHPLRFVLAMPQHGNPFSLRSPLALRAGMMLYRRLSGQKTRVHSAQQDILTLERALDSGHRWTLLDYEDAQCEFPERLIADWVMEAVAAGAVVRNHCEVLQVEVANGRATAVRTRDRFTGEESRFTASWIINATGPWADHVTASSSIDAHRMIGGVRGSHILLPRLAGASTAAVYSEALDGRAIFVIPWNGQTLVGTTEVADESDPGRTAPTTKEIQYLMQSFQRIFPKSGLAAANIISCYAGVRPLPFTNNSNASATTRKHFLHDHSDDGAAGLISVIGGKLTTATSLARECAKKMGINPSPLVEGAWMEARKDSHRWEEEAFMTQRSSSANLGPQFVKSIAWWHGDKAPKVINVANEQSSFQQPLCAHSSHIVAEAVYAARHEYVVTLGDILLRRVPVALSACWSKECSRTASQRIGRALGWSESQVEVAREDFEAERAAFLIDPASLKS